MSSVQRLRAFVTERLTAAAAEIVGAFEKTMEEYEAEIGRQRRLLDVVWRPEVKLHRLGEPTHQTACQEEDVPEQQLWSREKNPSLDHDEPEAPQVKEEQEELCSGPEPLVLKEETGPLIPAYEAGDHSEAEAHAEHHSFPVAESRDQEEVQRVGNTEKRPKKRRCKNTRTINHMDVSPTAPCETQTDEKAFECVFCGKTFKHKSNMNVHLRIHTGEEPYVCKTCGKRFRQISALKVHLNVHTGTVPFSCGTCGKGFTRSSNLLVHLRTHTGEKPYSCQTCGKGFTHKSNLLVHLRTHTGERPYRCKICGMCFIYSNELTVHMRGHTGEKPYTCNACGEKFSGAKLLRNHMKVHTTRTSCCAEPGQQLVHTPSVPSQQLELVSPPQDLTSTN